MAKTQNSDKTKSEEDVDQQELSFTAGGMQNGRQFGRQSGFLQN